jgi:hypothetical protein
VRPRRALLAVALGAGGFAVSLPTTSVGAAPQSIVSATPDVEVATDHPTVERRSVPIASLLQHDEPSASVTGTTASAVVVRGSTAQSFSTIGVSFASSDDHGGQIRVRHTDGKWGPWKPLERKSGEGADSGSADGASAGASSASDPLFVDDAIAYEAWLPGDATDVTVHRVQARQQNAEAATAADAPPAPAPDTPASATSAEALVRLGVHSRAEWGARPPKIHPGLGNAENGVKMVVVHHTASENDYTAAQAPKLVRDFQAYDMDVRRYDDLGYNVMVDRFGSIWEGRYGGLDQPVIGAHALGFNSVAMGIVVIGNFVDVEPPQAVINAVAKLAGWKLALEGYDPTSSVTITGDEADGHPLHPLPLTTPRIVGHRDVGQTQCPGLIWNHLGEIRTLAAAYAAKGTGELGSVIDNGNHTITIAGRVTRTMPVPEPPPATTSTSAAAASTSTTRPTTTATSPAKLPANVVVRVDRRVTARASANLTRPEPSTALVAPVNPPDPNDAFSLELDVAPGPHRVCVWETASTESPATGLEPQRLIGCRALTVRDPDVNPIRPTRVFDSRSASALHLEASGVRVVAIAGVKPIPTEAVAVAANITVAGSAKSGFLTAFPCGEAPPASTSNVNFVAGQTIAAMVLTKLDAKGQLCLFASTPLDAIVDVTAWFPVGGAFDAVAPTRLLDTRTTRTPLAAGKERVLAVRGQPGVPANAAAVALNVVAVDPTRAGWVSIYPCDAGRGGTSTVNFTARNTIANLAVTKLAADGTVCLYADSATDVIVDITGGFRGGDSYTPIAPVRIMDTRSGLMHKRLTDDDTTEVGIRGLAGVPTDATAVVVNLTMTNASNAGYATLYPCAQVWPGTSNVNYVPNASMPNLTLTRIGVNGCLRLYNEFATDAIIDVVGYLR